MSAYVMINVYNGKRDTFTEIAEYCRSSTQFKILSTYCGYGQARELDEKKIKEIIYDCTDEITNFNVDIKDLKEKIAIVKDMNNASLEEKMDYITEYSDGITECEDMIKDYEFIRDFLSTLDVAVRYSDNENSIWLSYEYNIDGLTKKEVEEENDRN